MDLSSFHFTHTPIDQALPSQERAMLYANGSQARYARGVQLFDEGSYPKGVFVLRKEKVKIYQRDANGGQQIMAIHAEGELMGYRPLLSEGTYPVSAATLEPCTIVFIPKKDFQLVLGHSPALANMLLKYLSDEFTVWVNTLSIMAKATVRQRVLLALLVLSEKYRIRQSALPPQAVPLQAVPLQAVPLQAVPTQQVKAKVMAKPGDSPLWPIRIGLSKADLACMVGTSGATLSRTLRVLKQEKLIGSRGRSIQIDSGEQLAGIRRLVAAFTGR